MSGDSKALAAICECGGWVMLAVLGHSNAADKDSYKEAGKLAGRGFRIEHTTVAAAREMIACKHHGYCTTNPGKLRKHVARAEDAKVEQPELAL